MVFFAYHAIVRRVVLHALAQVSAGTTEDLLGQFRRATQRSVSPATTPSVANFTGANKSLRGLRAVGGSFLTTGLRRSTSSFAAVRGQRRSPSAFA